jgi:hypothetical protein
MKVVSYYRSLPISDPESFLPREFILEGETLVRANGADIAPERLYQMMEDARPPVEHTR